MSSSKPYCSNDVMKDVVSASRMSALAEKESSAATDEMISSNQKTLDMILLLMKMMRPT